MTTWYRTHSNQIEPVEVVKETKSTVTVRRKRFFLGDNGPDEFFERKHSKISGWDCYFPTIQEACEHLRREAMSEVETAQTRLRVAQEQLERVEKYIGTIDEVLAAKEASNAK